MGLDRGLYGPNRAWDGTNSLFLRPFPQEKLSKNPDLGLSRSLPPNAHVAGS